MTNFSSLYMSMNRHLWQRLRSVAQVSLLALLGVTAMPVHAVTVNGLYDGVVRVKNRSDAARIEAFNDALARVLTKVSGRTDAAAKVNVGNVERLVQRFSYQADGQLEVGFDGAAINTLLESVGMPLWDRDRPVTLVVYPNSMLGLREAYMATELTARLRGVPMIWANTQSSDQYPAGNMTQIQELAQRYDAAAVLLARPVAGPTNLRWQMVFNGTSQERAGTAEEGPDLAADVLSRYYAASGKDTIRLSLAVAGVENLDAYAKTLAYVNGLLMVRGVAVDSLQRDVLRLRVDVRGSQDSLKRALAVDRKLVEVVMPDAPVLPDAAALNYRYNN